MTKLVIPWIKEKIYTEIGTDELVLRQSIKLQKK